MKRFIIAAFVLAAPAANAGEPPVPPVEGAHGEPAGAHGADPHGGGHHGDPTEHFNFLGYEQGKLFDYKSKDAYGGPLGDGKMVDPNTGAEVHGEEPGSPPFVLMLVNFGILLLILAKFGGPVARKLAQDRHDQIKTALDEAAKLREQAQQKLTEYEARIKDVDAEVRKLVDGIRADAEADKARILDAAAKQAAQMKKDAELRIAAEIELARAQLTKEVTAAATGATEKLLREKMTDSDQTKLVSAFITDVSSGGAAKEAR